MSDILNPIPRWSRELASLRARARKRRQPASETDLTDAALSACEELLRDLAGAHLACDRLRAEVSTQTAAWARLFDVMPAACVLTDSAGYILNANRAAGLLLNTSARHLKDRELLVFSEDREAFSALLQRLARGSEHVRTTLAIRPRERKTALIDVIAVPFPTDEAVIWVWFLSPGDPSQQAALRTESMAASG